MTPEPKEIGHQVRFPSTLVGLFKKGCWEIPEIMCSSIMAVVGIGFGIWGVRNYYKNDGDNREFKKTYAVVRPDDPRACKLKNPVRTKY